MLPDSLWDSEQDIQCKPEIDKDALASRTLYSSPPIPNALPSSSKPTSVKIRRFFSVPAKRCSVPIPLQCSCFGSFPEGQCQDRRLSGENTQLATPRNITTGMQRQAQPGKSSCYDGTLGTRGRLMFRVSKALNSICKPQKANA